MRTKASIDMSASFAMCAFLRLAVVQTSRKESPLFLFGAPEYSSMIPCTISDTWFTNFMMLFWSASVNTPKSLIDARPMIQSTGVPSTIPFTELWLSLPMLREVMLAPASPKPKASRVPSLIMVFSRIRVSIGLSGTFAPWQRINRLKLFQRFLDLDCSLDFCLSSALKASSANLVAIKGLMRIICTFNIMPSSGLRMRLFASEEIIIEAMASTQQMKATIIRLQVHSTFIRGRSSL
mmetsp:Transcript_57835/g.105531  ORF Transcript_57835/g.105531 Transcript_57835/m.105531 type:complete len:237 (+) Transcript_57835:66-776(+)